MNGLFAWFANLKIGTRILSAILVLTCAIIWLAGEVLWEHQQKSSRMQHVKELTVLAPVFSAVVHELQKERGRSAGFIGSKGKIFADILPQQRSTTDEKRAQMMQTLAEIRSTTVYSEIAREAEAAIVNLENLERNRLSVDAIELSVPAMAKYYTQTIMSLLSVIETMLKVSDVDEVSKSISAYLSLLQGKERAGRERAMGAGGFGSGQFKPAIYNNFIQLINAQNLYFENFRLFGTAGDRAFFDKTMTGKPVEEVARMREIGIKFGQAGELQGITGGSWFKQITAKIELMKQVEDYVATDVQKIASEKQKAEWNSLIAYAAALAVLLVGASILVTAIVKSITAPVSALTNSMHRLASGEKDLDISGISRKDEIGDMAKAVEVFRQNALKIAHICMYT